MAAIDTVDTGVGSSPTSLTGGFNSSTSAPPLTGNARDILRHLIGTAVGRTNFNPLPGITDDFSGLNSSGLLPGMTDTIKAFLANANTGLDPRALAALRQESVSGLSDRYQNAARNLRTNLLSRGLYGGSLPANSGALLEGFGPLESDLANAQSKAGADAEVANQQALLANRQLAANAVGMGTNLYQALGQLGLGQYGAQNDALRTAISGATGLAELEPTSLKNILVASLLGAGSKALTDPAMMKAWGQILGIGGGGGATAGGVGAGLSSIATPAIGAVAPSAASLAPLATPSLGAIAGGAVPEIPLGATAGGSAAAAGGVGAAASASGAVLPGSAGFVGPIAPAAGAGGAGGGVGASLASFFTNPVTIGVGAAIAAAIIWHKSQVHPQANTFVQSYQKPFEQHLSSVVDGFDKAYATGQMTKEQAQLARDKTAEYISQFDKNIADFKLKGKHEKIVADQAKAEMTKDFGANWEKILAKMDQEIAALPA